MVKFHDNWCPKVYEILHSHDQARQQSGLFLIWKKGKTRMRETRPREDKDTLAWPIFVPTRIQGKSMPDLAVTTWLTWIFGGKTHVEKRHDLYEIGFWQKCFEDVYAKRFEFLWNILEKSFKRRHLTCRQIFFSRNYLVPILSNFGCQFFCSTWLDLKLCLTRSQAQIGCLFIALNICINSEWQWV